MRTNKTKVDKKSESDVHYPDIVSLKDVVYQYHSQDNGQNSFTLGPVSFDIHKEEILVLLGPSGSGKTSLLRLISGLAWPSQGSISVQGNIVADPKRRVLPEKRGVGMVFQEHALFPHLSVRDNIFFGIQSWSQDEKQRRLIELEDLLGLRGLSLRFPHQLSGGQQQRVALARTLAPKPEVILMDEPLSNVDDELRSQLASELRDILKDLGITALWVTHDRNEALDLADRGIVINEGQIEQIDTPGVLYHQPKTRFVADFIGKAMFVKGLVKERMILTEVGCFTNTKHFNEGDNIEIMVRPEYVQIAPHDGGLGTIVKRQFRGAVQLYTILLNSGQYLLSRQPSTVIWPEGTRVRVSLDIKETIAFLGPQDSQP